MQRVRTDLAEDLRFCGTLRHAETQSGVAHNPEVAGSNAAPATAEGPGNGAFRSLGGLCGCRRAGRLGFECRRLHCSLRATAGCVWAERGVSLTPEGMRR